MKSLEELIQQLGANPDELYPALAKVLGYVSPPVDIDTFLDSTDYLGYVVGNRLYPLWRKVLREVYPNPFYSPYQEVVLTGAIGTGKTTAAIIGALYDLYKITLLKSPHARFKLIPTTRIVYAFMNATKELAEDVTYDQAIQMAASSPYFSHLMKLASSKKDGSLFPNRISMVSGSRAFHVLGQAVVGAVLDELNFQDRVAQQAYDNYTNTKRRMQSRFLTAGGTLPARLWLVSSRRYETSVLEEHIKKCRSDPQVLVCEYALWDAKDFPGPRFKVFVGDRTRDPFIVEGPLPSDVDPAKVIEVPHQFRSDFEADIYNALRDLAGVSTASSWAFIPSTEALRKCFVLPNPISKEVVTLSFRGSDRLMDFVDLKSLLGSDRTVPRYVHVDLALTKDRVGIASVRMMGAREREEGRRMDPWYAVDFVLGVQASGASQIPLHKIKDFLLDLSRSGYYIQVVSTDGYQSANLRQDLELQGFRTALVSVDRTMEPYLNLKSAILEGRIFLPKHDLLLWELQNLVETDGKVDHKPSTSKDVADAVAGAAWTCLQVLTGKIKLR